MEDSKRTLAIKSAKQGSYGLIETEASSTALHRSAPSPLGKCYGC